MIRHRCLSFGVFHTAKQSNFIKKTIVSYAVIILFFFLTRDISLIILHFIILGYSFVSFCLSSTTKYLFFFLSYPRHFHSHSSLCVSCLFLFLFLFFILFFYFFLFHSVCLVRTNINCIAFPRIAGLLIAELWKWTLILT